MGGIEQRRAPRKRVLFEGRVVFNNRFSLIECTVRDLSATGARIAFPHATPLPAEVELEVFKTHQSFRARVMWSNGKTHGLMFIDDAGNPLVPPEDKEEPPEVVSPPVDMSAGEIQTVIDEARHRIAQIAGVSPDAVRLKLEIDY